MLKGRLKRQSDAFSNAANRKSEPGSNPQVFHSISGGDGRLTSIPQIHHHYNHIGGIFILPNCHYGRIKPIPTMTHSPHIRMTFFLFLLRRCNLAVQKCKSLQVHTHARTMFTVRAPHVVFLMCLPSHVQACSL